MTELASAWNDADDARLLNMVRAGDSDAFAVLQERHEAAVRRLARHLVASPHEVHDVVAETFAWLLSVTRRGGGPSNAVRPYVLTALRRVCDRRLTGQPAWQRGDERLRSEPGEPFVEPSMAGLETALIARAYLSLPDRWRAVLWHVQVEQADPADTGQLLGLTRNGVAALDRRATDGLRQAYLQHYLSTTRTPECRLVAERLGVFVRDPAALGDAAMVSAHLAGCYDCRAVSDELTDVSGTLRAVVAPLVLGPAAAAYLFGPGDSGAAATPGGRRQVAQAAEDFADSHAADSGRIAAGGLIAAASLITGGRAATNAIRHAVRGLRRPRSAHGPAAGSGLVAHGHAATNSIRQAVRGPQRPRSAHGMATGAGVIAGGRAATNSIRAALRGPWRRPWSARVLAATAGVAVVAAVVLTIALAGNGGTPASSHGPARPAAAAKPAILPSSAPSSAPSVSPSPSAPASAAPASATLAASVNIASGQTFGHSRRLSFLVSDTGSASTGTITAAISLPAGSSVSGVSGGDGGQSSSGRDDSTGLTDFNPSGWNCQPTANGAVCTHAAIGAGQQAFGTLAVSVNDSAACGQPVVVTVTSGQASTQATQDLSC